MCENEFAHLSREPLNGAGDCVADRGQAGEKSAAPFTLLADTGCHALDLHILSAGVEQAEENLCCNSVPHFLNSLLQNSFISVRPCCWQPRSFLN